jgi:hypothetical protein
MGEEAVGPDLRELKRTLDQATSALESAEAAMLPNLMCRVSDLQDRFLKAEARSLGDVEARLTAIRDLVRGLGPAGFLLHLVDAAIADVRALRIDGDR